MRRTERDGERTGGKCLSAVQLHVRQQGGEDGEGHVGGRPSRSHETKVTFLRLRIRENPFLCRQLLSRLLVYICVLVFCAANLYLSKRWDDRGFALDFAHKPRFISAFYPLRLLLHSFDQLQLHEGGHAHECGGDSSGELHQCAFRDE